MSEPKKRVECRQHGVRDATYVCQHLMSQTGAGFHMGYADEDPDQLWPDAWCDACERVLKDEGGWNDRSEAFAHVRLLCDACYQTARERNWKQDDAAFDKLLADATDYLQSRQDQLQAQYRLGSYDRYDWNQDTGQLIFSMKGQPRVVADIQFVGSVSTRSNTWLWSWANESMVEPSRQRIREVRTYGEQHDYLKLACACWGADETDGWNMTAIAARLIGTVGAYRTPDDEGRFTFLVMTDVYWAQ